MARIRCTKTADYPRSYSFPASVDLTGYTATFSVAASEGSATLLALSGTATANGSIITVTGQSISILLKAADLATLPSGDPWVGLYQVRLTSQTGVTTRIDQDNIEVAGGV